MEVVKYTDFGFAVIGGRFFFPNHSLTLIVKGTFDLIPGEPVRVAAEQLFPTGDELYEDDDEGSGSIRYESDFAYSKPRADLLLVGKCYSPSKKPTQACRVTFQVGNRTKSLSVFGNRYWKGLMNRMSDPEPFTEMELRYENSFGGEGFKKNPIGKGYRKEQTETGSKVRPLPNVEDPQHLIRSVHNLPDPAGFGPLGKMWHGRFSKMGTYKGKWLEERWPWFAEDFDWSYFNAAASDMQIEGYLRGDEELFFENLHPIHSQYRSRLPGLRMRCFLNQLHLPDKQRPRFYEVPMNLDTLWADMEAEKLVLVWRGVTSIISEDYEDILQALIVSEKLAEPARSVDHYHAVLLERFAEEEEEGLEVEKPEQDEVTEIPVADDELAILEEQIRADLVAAGIDPDEIPPPPDDEVKKAEAQILKELGIEEEEEEEEQPLTRETVQKHFAQGEGLSGADLRGLDLSGLEIDGIDLQRAILHRACLKSASLIGANLKEANLAEADLSGALLQRSDLKDADLTNANLINADLTGAVLEGAILEGAKLNRAILDQVLATDGFFSGANLTEVSLRKSALQGADFSQCILNGADFQGAILREASVEGANGFQVNMAEADLTELRASEQSNFTRGCFRKASGKESIWQEAVLDEADFSCSNMEGADFTGASLKGADCSFAQMKFARFTKSNLRGASLKAMDLFQGSLEKADLKGADFRGSNLYGVEFLDAALEDAEFDFANLKMTKLARRMKR